MSETESAIESAKKNRARYIMVGGFLGAGKTTAIVQLARRLTEQGLRVGLITNDQGAGLVDTNILRQTGFAVEEIAGGCFCCRFSSLKDAADKLTESTRPDVFLAEPVGSCTDLVASVSYPLRRLYGEEFSVAPLSVLVDPTRAMRVLGIDSGRSFSAKVEYIYRKQLEEADIICINKIDTLDESAQATLHDALRKKYPHATIARVSMREGTGVKAWAERLLRDTFQPRATMAVDYDKYAAGEALLGWLNATLTLTGAGGDEFDGNVYLTHLAWRLQEHLQPAGGEVAHLKMTLSPDDGSGELGVVNLVRSDFIPELAQHLTDDLAGGELIVNIRAELAPDLIHEALRACLADAELQPEGTRVCSTVTHIEHFRPGKPEPTHRMVNAGEDF